MAKDPYADLFRFVAQAESGGRDYDAAGRVITSPKGAKGSMQVMDATNLDPGYGVRPAADDSLEERARVGQDYLKAMISNYGGDLTKGLAAYNAGPGNVDRALAAAQQAGDPNWMQYLPKPQETVPYVQKIVSNMGSQPGTLDRIAAAVMPSAQASPIDKKLEADPLYQMLSGAASTDAGAPPEKLAADPVWQMLNSPTGTASESRSPDGVRRVETSGTAPTEAQKQHTGVLGAIEGLGAGVRKMGQGIAQGFGDVPAGIGQAGMHQGQQILGGVDELLGTNLAAAAAPNVAARDAEVAAREAAYQEATPGSIAAGLGRLGGNIAFGMAGGPAAMAAPMMAGAQAGARALPMAPSVGRFLGAGVGSGIQGAGYGAVAPVATGDYDQQSLANTQAGAMLGAVAPGVGQMLGAGGRYIGNNIRAAIAPFTEAGREGIAQNIIAQAAKGGPMRGNGAQLVPGATPTLAEVSGNPGIANLQRTMRDVNPVPFVQREEANALARSDALGALRGTTEDLLAAKASRDTQAATDYLKTHVGIPVANTEYAALKRTPAFQSAFAQAEKMAQNAGGTIETKVANKTLANRGGSVGKPQTYVSGVGLQRIKQALDDQIGSASQAGERGKAANILGVKDKLLSLMDREIPGYAEARGAYAAASRDIDAMQYLQGMNLTDAQGNITLARVQSALRGLEKAQQKPGMNLAKSVTQSQEDALKAIRDDLLRAAQIGAGRSLGSNTAQNLAMQNMLSQALPGRLGALAGKAPAGTLGTALGSGVGYMIGGPLGAAAGGAVGGSLGRTASSAVNMNNEAIQGLLTKMLLNEGGSGLAALQGAARSARPITDMGGLQRLLYPAVSVGGALGLGRLSPNNGNTMQPVPNAF